MLHLFMFQVLVHDISSLPFLLCLIDLRFQLCNTIKYHHLRWSRKLLSDYLEKEKEMFIDIGPLCCRKDNRVLSILLCYCFRIWLNLLNLCCPYDEHGLKQWSSIFPLSAMLLSSTWHQPASKLTKNQEQTNDVN